MDFNGDIVGAMNFSRDDEREDRTISFGEMPRSLISIDWMKSLMSPLKDLEIFFNSERYAAAVTAFKE